MSKLTEMTIEEMLVLKPFKTNLSKTLTQLKISREKFIKEHRAKKHPIDDLIKLGLFSTKEAKTQEVNPEKFIDAYKSVLLKTSDLPAAQRNYIREVGDTVVKNTHTEMLNKEMEKKRNGKRQ